MMGWYSTIIRLPNDQNVPVIPWIVRGIKEGERNRQKDRCIYRESGGGEFKEKRKRDKEMN